MVEDVAVDRSAEVMRGVLTELRLVFHVMPSPQRFHLAYLARNRDVCLLLEAGNGQPAEDALAAYLDDAEREVTSACREYRVGAGPVGDRGKESRSR